MHPLWHLLPAATCGLMFLMMAQSLHADRTYAGAHGFTRDMARGLGLAILTLAATLISFAQPIAWAMEATR